MPVLTRHPEASGTRGRAVGSAEATTNGDWPIISYYVTIVRGVLCGRARFLTFVLASAMHAALHALLALAAGALAAVLSQRLGLGASIGPSAAFAPHDAHVAQVSSGAPFGLSVPLAGARLDLAGRAFVWSALGLGIAVLKGGFGVYATYVQASLSGELGANLRERLLERLLTVHRLRRPRHGDHAEAPPQRSTADVVAAFTDRVHDVELGLKDGFIGGLRAVAQLAPIVLLLFYLSPRTAAVAVAVLLLFGVVLGRVRAAYRKAVGRAFRERARLLEAADESVRHAELWVTYGAEEKARRTLGELGRAIARRGAGLEARAAAMSSANEVLGAAALVLGIGASRTSWFGPTIDGATLLAFALAFFLAYRPMRELADARLAMARASAAYQELSEIIGDRVDGEATRDGSDVVGVGADGGSRALETGRAWPLAILELRDLRLSHGGCGPINLRVSSGAIVVVAGPTGVGKTTLVRTLLGLEPSAGGEILYDGKALGDAPAGPARRPFAWVPQDAPLLADSLEANVGLGAGGTGASAALEPIGAGHLGGALAGARLGSGGRSVSGGERQWIALARAMATSQPVLLLDEPTSGLDADAQRRVLEAIRGLRGLRTVLLVTHRTEPFEIADVVVRLGATGAFERAA
jgi:ATP-binding cassette, subfamily B, bacterial